jgi:hypothetical protein
VEKDDKIVAKNKIDSTTIKRVHLLHHLSTIFINIFEGRPLFLGGFHLSGGTR